MQYRVQADGWSVPGRRTPSPQGVGRGGVRADTTLTVKRPPPSRATATTCTRARAGALTFPSFCLGGGVTRVWTRSKPTGHPCLGTPGRLWMAQTTRPQTYSQRQEKRKKKKRDMKINQHAQKNKNKHTEKCGRQTARHHKFTTVSVLHARDNTRRPQACTHELAL